MKDSPALLEVDGLSIDFPAADGKQVPALRSLSLEVGIGERVALVGESGSGKSVLALACMRLLPPAARLTTGSIRVHGRELTEVEAAAVRGRRIGLVFQEAGTALNPVYSVGFQLCETLRALSGVTRHEAKRSAVALLESVGIEPAQTMLRAYPHQLSGGQLQRVMIAVALAGNPGLLIADEPTTNLDLITQAEVLALFRQINSDRGTALLLISHDLAVVADLVDRVAVIYAGEMVEKAPTRELFHNPLHPYTRMLLAAIPGSTWKSPTSTGFAEGGFTRHGCAFAPRCGEAETACAAHHPSLEKVAEQRWLRCPVLARTGTDP